MARRSTRNKLRFQAQKAIAKCDKIFEHLKYLDDLGEGNHPIVNRYLPTIVSMTEVLRKTLSSFRDEI